MFKDTPLRLHKTDVLTQSTWKAVHAFLYALKNVLLSELIKEEERLSVIERFRISVQYVKSAAADEEKISDPQIPPYKLKRIKITSVVRDSFGRFIHATGWITMMFNEARCYTEWMVLDTENAIRVEEEKFAVDFGEKYSEKDLDWACRPINKINDQIGCTFEKTSILESVDFSPL